MAVPSRSGDRGEGDLSVTALYTSYAWRWAGFEGADLLEWAPARGVFRATNLLLWLFGALRRGAPSLPHGLAQRHAMLDHLLRAHGAREVLEIAAGLGRRGVAFSADPGLRYVELDLPPMVARKRLLLERTERGRAVLARENWVTVAGDATEVDLGALLLGEGPVLVIAEGLLMYLEAEDQRALWRRVAEVVARRPGSALAFDLVPAPEQPTPGWLGSALGWTMRRFTGGRGFVVDGRGRDQIRTELLAAGFRSVDLLEPRDLPAEAQVPYLDRSTQVLVFRCA